MAIASEWRADLPRSDALRLVRLPPGDPRWEAFVNAQSGSLIYHHPAWTEVLRREYDRPVACLACEDGAGRLQGILPMMRTRGLPVSPAAATMPRWSSLPRTPMAGTLTVNDEATRMLLSAAVDLTRADPGTRLELKLGSPDCDVLVDGLARAPWRLSYSLELPPRLEQLRFGDSRNHARIKWALKKAAKHGVRVRAAETLDDLRSWYPLYARTMQAHAVPVRPYRFFKAAWDVLRPRELMRLLVAEQIEAGRRTLLAGSMFLMFGQTMFYAFNGCRRQGRALRANDVLQWHAIHDACAMGYRQYDLGEVVETQFGLHEFKAKWGAVARRMYRYYYPSPAGIESMALESTGPLGRVARAAWRCLPWRATALLGDWLYSYL